jgi:hypothetical protein
MGCNLTSGDTTALDVDLVPNEVVSSKITRDKTAKYDRDMRQLINFLLMHEFVRRSIDYTSSRSSLQEARRGLAGWPAEPPL